MKEGKRVEGRQVIQWAKEKSNISRFMVPTEVEVAGGVAEDEYGEVEEECAQGVGEG